MAIKRLDQPSPSPSPSTEKTRSKIATAAPSPSALHSPSPRFAQAAGEKTADCAAVFCCFPCGIVNFLYVVSVKLPALLWRAVRRRRNGRMKKAAVVGPASKVGPFFCDDDDLSLQHGALLAMRSHQSPPKSAETPSPELFRLEKEMLESFNDLGFWRSLSQRGEEGKEKA